MKRIVTFFVAAVAVLLSSALSASAAPLWGTDASGSLTGTRSSAAGDGVQATQQWDNGGFSISWNITQNGSEWTYVYTVTADIKEVSHFLLEVTEDAENAFSYDALNSSPLTEDSPRTFSPTDPGGSNPLLPNPLYAVKFDFGSNLSTYTLVTEHAPVWGVFYSKDGRTSGSDVAAWSTALNFADYKTNESLTATDFIVRPNGVVPEPASLGLLGAGMMLLLIRRRPKTA